MTWKHSHWPSWPNWPNWHRKIFPQFLSLKRLWRWECRTPVAKYVKSRRLKSVWTIWLCFLRCSNFPWFSFRATKVSNKCSPLYCPWGTLARLWGIPLQVSSLFARSKACSLDHRQTWSWGLPAKHSLQLGLRSYRILLGVIMYYQSRPANLCCPDRVEESTAREWPTPKSVVTNFVEFRAVNAGELLLAWLVADGRAREGSAFRCFTSV